MSLWIVPPLSLLAIGCAATKPVEVRPPRPPEGDAGIRVQAAGNGGILLDPASGTDGIAARINEEAITLKDVDDRIKLPVKDITPGMRRQKLRELAEERLFLQWARKNQIAVSDAEIDDQILRDMRQFPGEEQYEAMLRASGMTKTENRERIRRSILVWKLYAHLIRKAMMNPDPDTPGLLQDAASPEEIRKYFEDHREEFKGINHVTVWRIGLQFSTPRQKEEKRSRAESILRQLQEGASFYILAHSYSDVWSVRDVALPGGGKEREREFGHRGLKREDAVQFYSPATVELLFETLEPGQTSGIVEDGRTFNIFQLVQRVNQPAETYEQAQPKIRNYLENRKREQNRRSLRDELVRRSYLWPIDLFQDE